MKYVQINEMMNVWVSVSGCTVILKIRFFSSYFLKDRLLWFGAVLQYSHYTTVNYFTSNSTHMY